MFDKGDIAQCEFEESDNLPKKCGLCQETLNKPLILSCLHIFDRDCLAKQEEKDDISTYIKCPTCSKLSGGLKTLKSFDVSIVQEQKVEEISPDVPIKCTICTEGNEAVFRCIDCAGTLCTQCKTIHKIVKFFSDHEVIELTEEDRKNTKELFDKMKNSKPVYCKEHQEMPYSLFCLQCHIPMCQECMEKDHKSHVNCKLNLIGERLKPVLAKALETSSHKRNDLIKISSDYQNLLPEVTASRDLNKECIETVYDAWIEELQKAKETLLEKNTKFHENTEMKIWSSINKISKIVDHIDYSTVFTKSYFEKCSNLEMCELVNTLINCFDSLSAEDVPATIQVQSKFKPGHLSVKEVVKNNFGYFEHEATVDTTLTGDKLEGKMPPPEESASNKSPSESGFDMSESFKRLSMKSESDVLSMFMLPSNMQISPNGSQSSRGAGTNLLMSSNGHLGSTGSNQCSTNLHSILSSSNSHNWNSGLNGMNGLDPSISPDFDNGSSHHFSGGSHFDSNGIQSLIENNVLGGSNPMVSNAGTNNGNMVNSMGSNPSSIVGLNGHSHNGSTNGGMMSLSDEHFGIKSNIMNSVKPPGTMYTPSLYEYSRLRNARCSQMNLLVKWGNMGCELGRLNSPHGFCLGFDEEIVVADTHNHRIQIFSKRGQFQSFFGVSGRVDGLLWYPRKVAIIRQSQRYVVCDRGNERSRMQLFSRSGHFVRRIAIRYIDIVAGLAINQHGHIVAIDSVSPSVFVVSEDGDLIKWFDCSNYMREPSDVAIHGREYYICDFKAHCVVVFQEDGKFIRRIGGETITDYPNGIDVSDHGDVLVGDSHGNRFHIAVFNRSGELQCEFVCNQTKVSRSCCLKITTEGYVVTLARSSNNVLVIDTLYVC